MKKIILLGYMGAGKSTIGKIIALKLNIPYFDLDSVIEQELNTTISNIFTEKGEVFFRKKEHEILHRIINNNPSYVLSLGGGTPCYANNHLILQKEGIISIYLKASITTLAMRLKDQKEHRPLLNNGSDDTLETFIAKHLFDRSYFYHQAKYIIPVDGKSTDEITSEILKKTSN